ncbi:exopolysaccharide biosynthesis protein [Hyphomonas sp.]|uniref:exopolysaccharide biosynthesis protein n=1 Tax=Hyphomonas sp. TaxID=87 RepID=UPI003D2E86E3|tara:strand:- start:95 stop:685 length:591 start_codon:yes stop_codon:yes gene_type:complete
MGMADDHPLEDLLDTATENTPGDKVSVGDLLDMWEDRTFGPVFTLLGLLVVLPPLGAVPGLPLIVGLVLVLFAFQMMVGSTHPWVPQFIEDVSVSKKKMRKAHKKAHGVLYAIDSWVTRRLSWVTSQPARQVASGIVMVLALTLIPLEMVPFAVGIPGLAITTIGLAILARDGVLMLLALGLSLAAFGVVGAALLA